MDPIVCYGDSNTFGYDPLDIPDHRYPPAERWPEILAELTMLRVINAGMNGRIIPWKEPLLGDALAVFRSRLPIGMLVVMLGTNDLLGSRLSASAVGQRMERFLSGLKAELPDLPVLLVAPPRVALPLLTVQEESRKLGAVYAALAREKGLPFADAGQWELPLSPDDVHFSPEAHRRFACRMAALLQKRDGRGRLPAGDLTR